MMVNLLKQEALAHGDRLQIITADCLHNLKTDIELFRKNKDLNDFQKWITDHMYNLEAPALEFTIKSIIIVANPHPSYAKVEFVKQGKKFNFLSLVVSDLNRTEKYLKDYLAPKDYHIESASNLPLKRLAVSSGLAIYGKNNICYIEGMGSFFSLYAYFSDIQCDNDDWLEMRHDDRCNECKICLKNCPTKAIKEDRFLIDNTRCLSFFNESPGEFPEWIPISVHHCLYDCLKCQIHCPMNRDYVNNVLGTVRFNEDETDMLLSGRPLNAYTPALKQKAEILGLCQWIDAIPRNLKVLLEASGKS